MVLFVVKESVVLLGGGASAVSMALFGRGASAVSHGAVWRGRKYGLDGILWGGASTVSHGTVWGRSKCGTARAPPSLTVAGRHGGWLGEQVVYPRVLEARRDYDVAQFGIMITLFGAPQFWFSIVACYLAVYGHRFAEKACGWIFNPQVGHPWIYPLYIVLFSLMPFHVPSLMLFLLLSLV